MKEAYDLVKKNESDELNEKILENANGGIAVSVALGAVGAFTLGGAALSFLAGYAYEKYYPKKKK